MKVVEDDSKAQALIPWNSFTDMYNVVMDPDRKRAVQLYSSNTGFPKANRCSSWLDLVMDEDFKYHIATQ